MQRFAVIGLGRFGSRLATTLAASGHEVIAVDSDPALVQEIRDRVTHTVALDTTDEAALVMQGLDRVDTAVVGIGTDFEATALTTVLLKQHGVKWVVARATSAMAARILTKIGADQVVNPEDEAADQWAVRLTAPQFLNHYELAPGHGLVEVRTPEKWVGKSLRELNIRDEFGVHVVAIKTGVAKDDQEQAVGVGTRRAGRLELPLPGRPMNADDLLVLIGKDEDLARVPAEPPGS